MSKNWKFRSKIFRTDFSWNVPDGVLTLLYMFLQFETPKNPKFQKCQKSTLFFQFFHFGPEKSGQFGKKFVTCRVQSDYASVRSNGTNWKWASLKCIFWRFLKKKVQFDNFDPPVLKFFVQKVTSRGAMFVMDKISFHIFGPLKRFLELWNSKFLHHSLSIITVLPTFFKNQNMGLKKKSIILHWLQISAFFIPEPGPDKD